jgi:probable O-glycosylation ligase (exosortase A-associated)
VRVLLVKLLVPLSVLSILLEPFFGVCFFMLIAFVRLEVLTWGMVDARFALITSTVTLIGWLLHCRKPHQRTDWIPVQYGLFCVVVLGMTLSTIYAEASVDDSWASVQKFYKYGIFLFLMIQMINTEKRLRIVQEVLFWGINFLVVWGFDQHFRGNERLERVGGGDFADSSALAALFLLNFPLVVYRSYHPSRWVRWSGAFFAPLYLVVLTFTQSRSGFLGALAAIALIFARAKHKLRYVLAAIPLGIALMFFMPESFTARMKTIVHDKDQEERGEGRERSADQRLKVWAVAWAVFKDHPILGVGRANFGLIHERYAYPIWNGKIDDDLYADLFLRYRVCHNIFLDLMVSNGLLTFIPWCLLMISIPYTMARSRRYLRHTKMDNYWRFQSYCFEIGVLSYLITGAFQDLAEVEAFYWYVMLSGITANVLRRRAIELGYVQEEKARGLLKPVAVAGIVTPGTGQQPLNPWHSP